MNITITCSSYLNLWWIIKGCTTCRSCPHIGLHPRDDPSQHGNPKHSRLPFHCSALLSVHIQHIKEDILGEERPEMAAAHHTQRPTMKRYWFEQNFSTQNPSRWLKEGPATFTNHRDIFSTYLSVYCHHNYGEENKIPKNNMTFNRVTSKHKLLT